MADLNRFVGIPYKQGGFSFAGADCWGLCLMVMRKVFDVNISLFEGRKDEGDDLEKIIEGEINSHRWVQGAAAEGMVCLMYSKDNERPNHIGVCSDQSNVLHSFGGDKTGTSAISSISALRKIFSKVEFYRYVG